MSQSRRGEFVLPESNLQRATRGVRAVTVELGVARMLLRSLTMRTPIDGPTSDARAVPAPNVATRYQAGTVLSGKYRLETLLGEGGMGAVWRANNELLDLPVAIKLIRADLDRGALRARLLLEARSAAKLGHPSIVRVFDVGESEFGDPFIVMEHLRGETLAQCISRERLPAVRAVQLLLPLIDALAVAHARGIVHRDLKPDNVMIALEEQQVCPKILDFGIAKLTDPRDADFKLTECGAVVGSPEYMSPEQARGWDDIDASTDIWSTCIVLYEAITGSTPFSATNFNALLRSIVEDAPKPLSEHGVEDQALWQILERGLQKEREQRYPSITGLGQALAAWLLSQGVTEDACGSTLDSKWLGRKSDPLNIAKPATDENGGYAASAQLRDSFPDSTGVARGPFTKTIQPSARDRTRRLGVVVAGCALCALSLFALGRSLRASPPVARAETAAGANQPSAQPAATAVPLEAPKVAPAEELDVRPQHAAKAAAESKPTVASARATRPAASSSRVQHSPPLSASAPPSPAPKSERPLDLLPPY